MEPRTASTSRTLSRTALAGAAGLGLCAIACAAPVLLASLGVGVASAVVCNIYEATSIVAVAIAASVGAVVMLRRRRRSVDRPCGCANDSLPSNEVIACDLDVFTAEQRAAHLDRARRVLSSIRHIREEENGFVMSFPREPEIEKEISLWIDGERRCCPFFRFAVDQPSDALSVRITGPAGAKDILAAGLQEYAPVSYEARAQ